jgi:hypothetical protein
MQEYLTKEEIRQWRSSLEKITLEEYAARLGKVIQGEKQTNDMIDKVMTSSLHSMSANSNEYPMHAEKLQTLTLRTTFETKEATTTHTKKETPKVAEIKEVKKETKKNKETTEIKPLKQKAVKTEEVVAKSKDIKTEVIEEKQSIVEENKQKINVTFKKPLIPREQMIFDYMVQNSGSIVYAKDMAALLELPRDYVYKYIKNLRQKINEEVLFNADNGGYILKV